MSRIAKTALALAIASGSASLPSVSRAADLGAQVRENDELCGKPAYLNKISARFDYQVMHVPNLPQVSILDFRNVREDRYIPDSEDWPIARRYCTADVVLSDGNTRDLWYLVEGRMGFVGLGENVEFCVAGFDRWFVYNGRCRVLR